MAFTPMTPPNLPRSSPVCPGAPVKMKKSMMRMKPYTFTAAKCSPAPRVVDIPPFDPYTGKQRFDTSSLEKFRTFMEEEGRAEEFDVHMYDIVRPYGTTNYIMALMLTPDGLRQSSTDMITWAEDDIFVIPHNVTDEVDIVGFLGEGIMRDSRIYCEVTPHIFFHVETGYSMPGTQPGPYLHHVSVHKDAALTTRQQCVTKSICSRMTIHEKNTVMRAFLHWQTIYTSSNPYGGPREAADYEWKVLEKGGIMSMVRLSKEQKIFFSYLVEETKAMIERGDCEVREVSVR